MFKKNLTVLLVMFVTVCALCAFQFSPLENTLEATGTGASAQYTVINDSDDQIAVQISVQKRDQDATGAEIRSDASAEFQIYPTYVILQPQSTMVVQVRYRGPATVTTEKSYRLTAEQIPYSKGKSQSSQSMFNFLYVYYTSLYVSPSQENVKVEIASVKARIDEEGAQVMDVTVRNRGNVHQILTDSELIVTDANGNKVVLTESEQLAGIDSINILAKKTVTKTLPWPEDLPFVEGGTYSATISYTNL